MPLTTGSRLGPYEVTARLGEGGMGEVYRARDTMLDRDVALKILPVSFASDPDRLMRFEREAKTLASLNHPNIAAIYGIEETGDTRALVMELVEGEDLSERLARGPIPLDEALPIARQVAEALEAAHEAGIIHRDLKPANIKVRGDGTVKVLDFGLAKAMDPMASSSPDAANSPTMTSPALTQMGVILGTAAYMAPEQAKGKPVDRRADIWAYGVVLYEMLTGKRAFQDEDVSDLLVAVLSRDVDLSALPSGTPRQVRQLVARCLDRNLKTRLQHIGEARIALSMEAKATEIEVPSGRRSLWPAIGAFAAGILLATGVLWTPNEGNGGTETPTYRVLLPAPDWGNVGYSSGLYLSPDGRTVGYHERETGALRLHSLDSWESRVVPGTAGSRDGFLSPDGRWFAYCNTISNTLEKVLLDGGTPVLLASDIGVFNSGVWGRSGNIYVAASIGVRTGIWRMREDGSHLEMLKDRDVSGIGWFLDLLPDENALLYTASSKSESENFSDIDSYEERIEALVLADNSTLPVMEGGRQARYLEPGHLVVVTGEGSLSVVDFNPETLKISGAAQRLVESVRIDNNFNARYTVSSGGTLAYVNATPPTENGRLVRIRTDGSLEYGPQLEVGTWRQSADRVWLSPDGTTLSVLLNRRQYRSVGLVDAQRGRWSPLVNDGGAPVLEAVWSRDGSRIAFGRGATSGFLTEQLWVADASGARAPYQLKPKFPEAASVLQLTGRIALGNWSPDSSRLVMSLVRGDFRGDLWILPVSEEGAPEQFLATEANEVGPLFSPDGNWIAYLSDTTGQFEAYVQAYPGPSREVAISRGGARHIVWRSDGRGLYLVRDRKILEVSFEPGQPPRVGQESLIAELPEGASPRFDVDPTTGDLVTIQRPEVPESDEVRVIINWGAELARQRGGEK